MSDTNDNAHSGEGTDLGSENQNGQETTNQADDLPLTPSEVREYIRTANSLRNEIKDMRREQRKHTGTVSKAVKPVKQEASVNPDLQALQARIDFRDAVDESGLTLTGKQRKALEKLYMAEGHVDDLGKWLADQAELFGMGAAKATPSPQVPQAPQKKTNLTQEAPAGNALGNESLPEDPSQLTQEAIDRMTPEQAKAYWNRLKSKNGTFVHPFAKARGLIK